MAATGIAHTAVKTVQPSTQLLNKDLVTHIAAYPRRYTDLVAMSGACKSWNGWLQETMTEIRGLALKSAAVDVQSERFQQQRRRYSAFALEYAVSRLIGSARGTGLEPLELVQLSHGLADNLPVRGNAVSALRCWQSWSRLQGIGFEQWSRMARHLEDDKHLNLMMPLLAVHPGSGARFLMDKDHKKARTAATLWLQKNPPTAQSFDALISRLKRRYRDAGKVLCDLLLSAVLFDPEKNIGLLECARSKLATVEFFDFTCSLSMRLEPSASASRKLASVAGAMLATTEAAVWGTRWPRMLEVAQYVSEQFELSLVPQSWQTDAYLETCHRLFMGLAKNIDQLVSAIPAEKTKQRRRLLQPVLAYLATAKHLYIDNTLSPAKERNGLLKSITIKAAAWLPGCRIAIVGPEVRIDKGLQ